MRDVGQLEREPQACDPVAPGRRVRRQDVDVLVGQHRRDIGEQSRPVERLDLDGDDERCRLAAGPRHLDHPLRLAAKRLHVRTIAAMNAHALAARHEPDDLVARNRRAASAEPDPYVGQPLHHHALRDMVGARDLDRPRERDIVGHVLVAGAGDQPGEPRDDRLRRDVAVTHGDVQRVEVRVFEVRCDLLHRVLGRKPLERQVLFAHLPLEQIASLIQRILAPTAREPLPDLVASARGRNELEPVLAGPLSLGFRGQDLDRIAGPQFVVQRHELAVDLGADRAVPDLGVDGVREVDGRRALRQVGDVALRREHEDAAPGQVDPQALHELAGVGHVLEPLHHLAEPGEIRVLLLFAFLVAPVRRDPVLRGAVHVACADLDLDRAALGTDHRRVQRLVHVRLGHRDVVLEPPRHRLPERMDRAEGGVTILHRLDLDPDADQVVDLLEVLATDHHLFVDGIQVLRSAVDVGLDAELFQLLAKQLGEILDPTRALVTPGLDELRDLLVRAGMQRLEREVLELPLHLLDTETIRERRVDLEGLRRDATLLGGRERGERAHVVQPVGELDQQDADVAGHRDDHLADVLRLGEFARLERQLVELREAVDDLRHVVAELVADRVERHRRVFDRVVEQSRLERRRVEPKIGEDLSHRERVFDERLARKAALSGVGLLGGVVRRLEAPQVTLGVVRTDLPLERVDPGRLRVGPSTAWQRQPAAAPCGGLNGYVVTGIHAWESVYGRDTAPPRSVLDQREEVEALHLVAAVQELKLDQGGDPADLPADPLHQAGARLGGPAGREDVVDDEHSLARLDGVTMDLERRGPVLEGVGLLEGFVRELSFLADGDDARAEVIGDRGPEDEPAGLDPDHLVDVAAPEVDDDQVDDRRERDRVREHRRDVLEDDARLGEIRDVADQRFDLLDLHGYLRLRLAGWPFLLRAFGLGRGRDAIAAGAPVAAASSAAAIAGCAAGPRTVRVGWVAPPPFTCRSWMIVRTGAAMNIEEYAPIATPMNIANAKSFSVWPPNSSSDRIGKSTTRDVFTDRITVWFNERSTTPV